MLPRIGSCEVMSMKARIRRIAAAVLLSAAMTACILDAKTASLAAAQAIRLCAQAVAPSLLPFLVLTRLFLCSAACQRLVRLAGPVMGPLFGLPPAAAPALVLGLLGGYPVGARTAGTLYTSGQLTRQEAERLLAFCSNAGPAFLFGILGGCLGAKQAALVFALHLLSALLTGALLAKGRRVRGKAPSFRAAPVSLPEAVRGALEALGQICAYVVLFSVAAAFLGKWLPAETPSWLRILLGGLLELSGGCCKLSQIPEPNLRFLLGILFPTFGGLCVWMQTVAVTRPAGLTARLYLPGKLLQTALALALGRALLGMLPGALPAAALDAPKPGPHAGLLRATGIVTAAAAAGLGIWCGVLEKRAGKSEESAI